MCIYNHKIISAIKKLSMQACMYVCTYVCMYAYLFGFGSVYAHVYILTLHTYTFRFIAFGEGFTGREATLREQVLVLGDTYILTYKHTFIHEYAHIQIYILTLHTYIHTLLGLLPSVRGSRGEKQLCEV